MTRNLHGTAAAADRSASVVAPRARYLARNVTSRRRPLLLALTVLLFGSLAALLVWWPLDPFEEDAGPLDTLLPPGIAAAVRFDPAALAGSPSAELLWRHPGVVAARRAAGLDERVLSPLADLEDRLGAATLGLAQRLERDVIGQDVIVALRGDDVLFLSRLTTRGKLLEALARADTGRLRGMGLRVVAGVAVLDREGAPPVFLRRVRDVLVASTSRELLETATALGDPPHDVARGPSRFARALDSGRHPRARLLVWALPPALAAAAQGAAPGAPGGGGDGDLAGLLSSFFPLASLDALEGELDLGARARVTIRLRGGWSGEPPAALRLLARDVGAGADGLLAEARRLAVPGEAVATMGLAVRAAAAVRALADAQPPARRDLLDEILAERYVTVDVVAERIATHLQDGVGGVVARIDEADALELDDPRKGGVHPIPATLVVFRLRGDTGDATGGATGSRSAGEAVIRVLSAEAEALFGSPVAPRTAPGPGGARVFSLAQRGFGGEWALLRPAFAIVDDLLVFCTHEGYLRRALVARAAAIDGTVGGMVDGAAGGLPAAAGPPARTIALRIDGGPLRRTIDDRRWAFADEAARHDWRTEREAIRRELDRSGSILSREDRQVYENERIALQLERRNQQEFPAAIEHYREAWRPLEALRALSLRGDRDGTAFDVTIVIELAEPQTR